MSNNIENLHIKELTIDNYKSLKNSKIELKSGLNIIIGKNGAGKSNLLEFINQYASKDVFFELGSPSLIRTQIVNFSVTFEYNTKGKKHLFSYSILKDKNSIKDLGSGLKYHFTFSRKIDDKVIVDNRKISGLISDIRSVVYNDKDFKTEVFISNSFEKSLIKFNIPTEANFVSAPISLSIDESGLVRFLIESSFNFFDILEFYLSIDFLDEEALQEIKADTSSLKTKLVEFIKGYFEKTNINEVLKTYSLIQEIRINNNINVFKREDTVIVENLFIEFLIGNDWLPWSYLSDGTKRLFYLITECISIENGIILVEEPELGIHPHQLFKLMDFLKEQSRTKQVIITTHSPMVLDVLNEDELDRITIAEYDKGTKFLKLDKAQISKAKQYINEIGDLSYY